MMSQHLNSMLEHLKMGSLINKNRNNNSNSSATVGNGSVGDHIGNGFNNNNNGTMGYVIGDRICDCLIFYIFVCNLQSSRRQNKQQ